MSAAYRRQDNAEMLELDGDTLILNQNTFAVTKLNDTGGLIWKLIVDHPTVEQLSERIAAEYRDALPDRIKADVLRFLNQMTEIGLIRLA